MGVAVAAAVDLARELFGIDARRAAVMAGGASANFAVAVYGPQEGPPAWVLRCCLRDPRAERIVFLAEFALAARRAGLSVPLPQQAVDGRWWATDAHDRPWVLLSYMPGRPLAQAGITPTLAREAGGLLAAFHTVEGVPGTAPASGPDTMWDAWLTAPEATRAAANQACGQDAALLAAYEPFLADLHRAAGPLLQLGEGVWTHGDFHGHNLLTDAGSITALIDLDAVARRPRAFDLATAALMLARTGSGDYRLQQPLAEAVLDGYQRGSACPLTTTERAALWPAMVLSQLPDPGHLHALRRSGRLMQPALVRPLAALRALREQRLLPAVPRPRRTEPPALVLGCEQARVAVNGPVLALEDLAAACRPWIRTVPGPPAPGTWALALHSAPAAGRAAVASRCGADVRRGLSVRDLHLSPARPGDCVTIPAIRLLRALMRRQLASLGELFLDAAVLDLNGQTVALVGSSCSGKTSTLVTALYRYRCRLVANDDASVRVLGSAVQARGYPRAVEVRRDCLPHLGAAAGPLESAAAPGTTGPLYLPGPAFAAALRTPTAAHLQLDALVLLAATDQQPHLRPVDPGEAEHRLRRCLAAADPYETWLNPALPAELPPDNAAADLALALPVWELSQPITALRQGVDLLANHDLGARR